MIMYLKFSFIVCSYNCNHVKVLFIVSNGLLLFKNKNRKKIWNLGQNPKSQKINWKSYILNIVLFLERWFKIKQLTFYVVWKMFPLFIYTYLTNKKWGSPRTNKKYNKNKKYLTIFFSSSMFHNFWYFHDKIPR